MHIIEILLLLLLLIFIDDYTVGRLLLNSRRERVRKEERGTVECRHCMTRYYFKALPWLCESEVKKLRPRYLWQAGWVATQEGHLTGALYWVFESVEDVLPKSSTWPMFA